MRRSATILARANLSIRLTFYSTQSDKLLTPIRVVSPLRKFIKEYLAIVRRFTLSPLAATLLIPLA